MPAPVKIEIDQFGENYHFNNIKSFGHWQAEDGSY